MKLILYIAISWFFNISLFAQTFTSTKGPLTTFHDLVKDNTGTIYLASHTKGVFKSTDEGQNWVGFGGQTLGVGQVNALTFNSSNQLLAATDQGGVKFWNGTAWITINSGITTNGNLLMPIRAIVVDAAGNFYAGGHSYASVFPMGDLFKYNGSTWSSISSGLTNTDINSLAISPISTTIFAGTDGGGVFKYNGSAWAAVNTNLGNLVIHKLIFATNGDLFAGTNLGVFKLPSGTNSWVNLNLPTTDAIQSIAIDNSNVSHILVGTGALIDLVGSNIGKIYQTNNGGTNWSQVGANIATTSIRALLFSSNNTFIGAGWGSFRSTNNGVNWSVSSTGLSGGSYNFHGAITITASPDHHIFYGSDDGVFRSTDGGTTWKPSSNGMTRQIVKLLKTDSQGNLFCSVFRYLGTGSVAFGDGLLYKSKDDGNTWTPVNIAKDWQYNEINELLNGDLICSHGFGSGPPSATIVGSGLAISHDHGSNWTDLNIITGMGYCSAVNPAGNLFMGGESNGVYKSVNGGSNFQLYALPGLNGNVGLIKVSPTGEMIVSAGGIRTLRFSSDNGVTYANFSTSLGIPDYKGVADVIFDNVGKAYCTTNGQSPLPSLFTILPPFTATSTSVAVMPSNSGSLSTMLWDDCGFLYIYSYGSFLKSNTALNITTGKNQVLRDPSNNVVSQEYNAISAATITATNKIFNNGTASFYIKNFAVFNTGFEAQNGSVFSTYLGGCGY